METLLTREMVKKAIQLSLPTIQAACKAATWGPEGLSIGVELDGWDEPVYHLMKELGPVTTWPEKFGKNTNFNRVVDGKLETARKGFDSHRVVSEEPWLLTKGCSFYEGAIVSPSGKLRIATSGAYGFTDRACGQVIYSMIFMLCRLKITELENQDIHSFQ